MTKPDRPLYEGRRLGERYPDLDTMAADWFSESLAHEPGQEAKVTRVLSILDRLVDLSVARRIAVIGCGPRPETMTLLAERGFEVIGIEPVESLAARARVYLGATAKVMIGAAESIPLGDESHDVVFLESVLEHVESPIKSLTEAFRILAPGGVALVITTNRLRFSNKHSEFNVPFYNWLPRLVKESYVHSHLHFDPSLANYTTRPAVHWFTFSSLCALGRDAGFAHFYSHLDLTRAHDPSIRSSRVRRAMINLVRFRPWFRALALTQVGGLILMRKRPLD